MHRVPTLIPDVGDLSLFARCNRHELARLRSLLTAILVPAGKVLIDYGAPAREFVVVADGEVSVVDEHGVERAVLGPGAIVGELGLLRDMPAGATVTTLTPVIAYVGNRREFRAMLETSPEIDRRVYHVAMDRLRWAI
jgi:CRP/FNR family cyclic AMP-dependent transcriptional regulator